MSAHNYIIFLKSGYSLEKYFQRPVLPSCSRTKAKNPAGCAAVSSRAPYRSMLGTSCKGVSAKHDYVHSAIQATEVKLLIIEICLQDRCISSVQWYI